MKTKIILSLLVMALVITLSPVILLAAEEDPEPVTIQFWTDPRFQDMIGIEEETQDPGDYERMQADRFEEKYPHVNIEVTSIPWEDLETKVVTAIRAGEEPDILKDYLGRTSHYAYQGLLEPLDLYLSEDYLDNYLESYLEMYTIDGHLHGLPSTAWAQHMLINAALWEEKGKAEYLPDGHNWTFAEFEEAIRAIAEPEEDLWPYGLRVYADGQADYAYLGSFYGMGGEVYSEDYRSMNIDSAENQLVVEMFQRFYEDELIIPGFASITGEDFYDLFYGGNTAIIDGSLAQVRLLEIAREEGRVKEPMELRVMNYPHEPGVINGLQLGPTGFVVFEQEDEHKRDWIMKFTQFLNNEEHVTEAVRNIGQFPAKEIEIPEEVRDEHYEAVQSLIEERGFKDIGLLSPAYSEMRSTYAPIMQDMVLGQLEAREGLMVIEREGNRILERTFERLPDNIWE